MEVSSRTAEAATSVVRVRTAVAGFSRAELSLRGAGTVTAMVVVLRTLKMVESLSSCIVVIVGVELIELLSPKLGSVERSRR